MSSIAKLKGNDSIFEVDEAEDYINTTKTSEGQTLKQLGVKASDLFNFISALMSKKETHTAQVQSGVDGFENSYTSEEIEDISIQTVTDGVRQARELFDAQKAQQGKISDFVNETKETFDTEYASSRVNRYLMNEEFCAQALQRAKEGNLTEKEYLEAKIELAVKMLPELQSKELKSTIIKQILTFGLYKDFENKTKAEQERIIKEMEIEYLKEALKNLTPEELTVFIKKVTSSSDDEYKEQAPKVVENLINQTIQKKEIDNKPVLSDSIQIKRVNLPRPGSIEDIVSHQDAYRVMEFEETFSKERGVEYNSEAIMNYSTKEAHLQFLVGMHNRNEAIKNILHDATVAVDGNNKYGAPQHDTIETCNQNLANQIETAFRSLYSKNAAEAQRVIDEIMGQDSGIKVIADEQGNFIKLEFYGFKRNSLNLDLSGGTKSEGATQESGVGFENNKFRMPVNSYSLVQLSKGLQQKLEDNYQTALKGKTLDDYSSEVESAYQMAYGAKNAQDMANAFAQSQQEGVQNTKAVVQGLGMVVMVAGQLIPVGGQVATALVMGGMATSTLGSVGVSAVENYTKAGGPTEEDKQEMLKELSVSLALVSSGMGIGKGSEAIFRTLVMKNCPKLIAFAAEVGVDATASLLADYAITGQIDLSGEGVAQLQSILVGVLHAKGNFKTYMNTHAGDISGVKSNNQIPMPQKQNFGLGDNRSIPENILESNIQPSIKLEDLDGAVTSPQANNGAKINTYKLNSRPNAKLKEYYYTTSNGRTYKFMAIDGIDLKNYEYLVNLDLNRRKLSNAYSRFDKFSDNTQIRFARLLTNDNAYNNRLLNLYRTINDEDTFIKILNDKNWFDKKMSSIQELEQYCQPNDFEFLGGLLEIKECDPSKYNKIVDSGILNLIKENKLSAATLCKLGKNADLSDDIYNDLALLKSGKSIVPEFAEGTDLKTAFEQTKLGDAVEVGGKMYLNDGNSLIEWNMTKEKYLELFPPVERFAVVQGAMPDCYLIQTLGLGMHNPKARVEFLQSFKLDGDNVVVTVKGLEDYHGSKTFTNGNIELPKNNKHIIGCKGLQMYEQTYATVALRENSPVDYPSIASVDDVMNRIYFGQAAQTMADVFGQGHIADIAPQKFKFNADDATIHQTSSYASWSYDKIPYQKDGRTILVDLNSQKNNKTKLFIFNKYFEDYPNKTLALKNLDVNTLETLVSHTVNNQDYLISFGTVAKQNAASESSLLPEYNIVSNHAYSILGYDENTKMVKIGNPHAYGEVTEIPLETLHQYIQHIDFLKL